MKGEKGKQMLKTIRGREAQRRKGDEGFTLIELLVVIVILAILAAIVVFAVGGIGDRGQSSACSTDLKTIQTAQEAFYANPDPGTSPRYAVNKAELQTKRLLTTDTGPSLHSTDGTGTSYTITAIAPCTNNYP